MSALKLHTLGSSERVLVEAVRALTIWEQQAEDLAYDTDDVRREIPDNEMPPEYIAERERLRTCITWQAAIVCGEGVSDAAIYADTHSNPSNPYNADHVRLAVAIMEWLS